MNKCFFKCRLCLKLGDFCSIFEQDECVKLSEMVMSFANVKIYEGDGYSDRVCTSCIENLSTAYLFKLQCEKISQLLQLNSDNKAACNGLHDKEVLVTCNKVEDDTDHNVNKDAHFDVNICNVRETSDETDSDIDSIKCVYCDQSYNSFGAHTCHVTCTIETKASSTGSDETLVAADADSHYFSANSTLDAPCEVSCVLCDEKYNNYDGYVKHIDICTANVKLRYFVCSICHEINTEKEVYLLHLNNHHFKQNSSVVDLDRDCVDNLYKVTEKQGQGMKSARRQIGWSFEDIYQEIDPVEEKPTPTSSPIKSFFAKLGNDTFSKHSTPRKVSFRKLIEDGKAKTSNYLPFKRLRSYKVKKKDEDLYSPVIPKSKRVARLKITETISDSDCGSPSSTSEDSWKLKQNLICACDKKVFMISEHIQERERIVSMLRELGGVVAENTKMEMLATHFIAMLPEDSYSGMMVCSLATGKWLLHINYVHDSFRGKKFLNESLYEWMKHPKILEVDNTSVEISKAASYWRHELANSEAKMPFEGAQVVLIMKKKYRQYYQMVFKTLKAKPLTYDPRTPGSCCTADYCFVDMRVIERVKLQFFAKHNIPVYPYQYILIYLLNRGRVDNEAKYLLQDCNNIPSRDTTDLLNKTL